MTGSVGIIGAATAAIGMGVLPAMAEAVPPLCLFTTDCSGRGDACQQDSFTVEIAPIDHEPGLWFAYDGNTIPAMDVTPDGAETRTFLARGDTEQQVVTVFGTGAAIHAHQFVQPDGRAAQRAAFGQCEAL